MSDHQTWPMTQAIVGSLVELDKLLNTQDLPIEVRVTLSNPEWICFDEAQKINLKRVRDHLTPRDTQTRALVVEYVCKDTYSIHLTELLSCDEMQKNQEARKRAKWQQSLREVEEEARQRQLEEGKDDERQRKEEEDRQLKLLDEKICKQYVQIIDMFPPADLEKYVEFYRSVTNDKDLLYYRQAVTKISTDYPAAKGSTSTVIPWGVLWQFLRFTKNSKLRKEAKSLVWRESKREFEEGEERAEQERKKRNEQERKKLEEEIGEDSEEEDRKADKKVKEDEKEHRAKRVEDMIRLEYTNIVDTLDSKDLEAYKTFYRAVLTDKDLVHFRRGMARMEVAGQCNPETWITMTPHSLFWKFIQAPGNAKIYEAMERRSEEMEYQ